MADALSIGETFFFREPDHIKAAVDVLVPRLVAANPGSPIMLWSAACATGEEPLSLAMALNEAGWFKRHPIRIEATDMSGRAVARARAGVFRDWSFRNIDPFLLDKYFTRKDEGLAISREILEKVSFHRANIMEDGVIGEFGCAPIVFCRNVFIYFSERAIRKVASGIYQKMPSTGYLFLASAESLLRIFPAFELDTIGRAFVYIKR